MQDAALVLILAATVVCLYLRPFGARDWQVALAGAALAWAAGPLGLRDGAATIRDSGNILAFFFGLMLLAAGAEAAGLYARAAALLRGARTLRARTALVLAAGFVLTAILSNDATPLILTPAIAAAALGNRRMMRQPAFAATFMADGASLVLPISNPVNLLFFERFDLDFGHYLATIAVAAVAGAAAMAVATMAQWRTSEPAVLEPPEAAPEPEQSERAAWPALLVVAVLASAYVAAGVRGVPLGAVTLGGGVAMLVAARMSGRVDFRRYRKHVAPGVLVFVASLLVLVESVERAGLLGGVGDALHHLESGPTVVTISGAAIIAALLANLLNNWPSALLIAAAIAAHPGNHESLVAGALIGSTIGANFTAVGSLSTVFWLSLNRQAGVDVSPAEYARASMLPTAAGLVAACLVAALVV